MIRRFARLAVLSLAVASSSLAIITAQPPNEPAPAVENMHPAHKALYFTVRRGTEWLMQAQQPNGMFHQGLNVAVNTPLEAAHFYHQVEGAIALGRVSRLTLNPRYHAAAQQATLTLLASTKVDPQDPQLRYTLYPETTVNRLASAGLLLRAVHELPVPVEVRLKEAEGLAQYIRTNQQAEGRFQSQASSVQQASSNVDQDAMNLLCQGFALEGLAISQTYSPANWKSESLLKAVRAYQQQMPLVVIPNFITGLTDTYFRTKDANCAAAVFNMADALCNVQQQVEPGKVAWVGGFMTTSSKTATMPPLSGESARCVSALCDAYRVAKQAGDAARAERYRQCASMGVQFVVSLQYTGVGVEHFAESYQPRVLGAFRASVGEGVIRLQDTAECVLAVSTYLSDVCGVSMAPAQATPAAPAPVK
ncbi:MAG TPA: hypothetical protein PLN21_22675 [Gemmatales bacterium]|nr:hypothetical protein [Gemmatales bacterium]